MARGAIDIGSNSILLTIVDDEGRLLHDEARIVGLGAGLGDRGLFASDRLAIAEATLSDYTQIAQAHGIEPWSIKAVATSAARRAMNADTWLARMQRRIGLRVRIVSGEEEAKLTWIGACRDLELPLGPRMVVDLGGGSTEIVIGTDLVEQRVSLELGSARLTEQFLQTTGPTEVVDSASLARLRNHVDVEIQKVRLEPSPQVVVAVAGTATTLASMALNLAQYDPLLVHGTRLGRIELARFIDQLLPTTPAQRRAMVPSAPDRADFLLAGATVLERILAAARRPDMYVSDRGLRYGLLA